MKILYDKSCIAESQLEQINKLFINNYEDYHYSKLTSSEGIKNLIACSDFECLCVVENGMIIGFAAYYQNSISSKIKVYKLAHLLVDKKHRGEGIGKLLEDERLLKIENNVGEKIIIASCVEKPRNSCCMKKDRGFTMSGYKYKYRKQGEKKENAIIMIKSEINSEREKPIMIRTCNKMTKRLLIETKKSVTFDEEPPSYLPNVYYSIEIEYDKHLGRKNGRITLADKDTNAFTKIKNNIDENEYYSVLVDPSIEGFQMIDKYLIDNKFYPISYIPYINNMYGEIEYQYICEEIKDVITDPNVSVEGKEFIKKIVWRK